MPYRAYLPNTTRQTVGTVLLLLTVALTVGLGVNFAHKERLRHLQEREWRFWTAVAKENDSAIVVVDCEDGVITGWNEAATKLLGWTPAEVEGSPYTFLVPEEYVTSRYGSLTHYFNKTTSTQVYDHLQGTVKVINGSVNTKSGVRRECRLTLRTIGGARYFYVAVLDPVDRVEEITPPITVPAVPYAPPIQPSPDPAMKAKGVDP